MVDINYWLGRKYDILAQEANARTTTANATQQNAATGAMTGAAAANLDRVRAGILPDQAAADIGLAAANTGLANAQASIVVPESRARIRASDAGVALTRAQTGFTTTQDNALKRDALQTRSVLPQSLQAVMGNRAPWYGISDITSTRRAGETEAAYLDRINGL